MTIIHQFPARVLRTWRKITTQSEKWHWVHRFIARELIKWVQKSTSQYHAVGPKCKSRWVNGTNRAKKKPKTNREGGGRSPERHKFDEKWPSYINFPLVFCGPEGKLRLRVKNDTGYIDLSLGVDKMGPKINKPVPRRWPKMQITMGEWDKQGQKEAQNQ